MSWNEKKFRIVPFWVCYIVQQEMEQYCWFFFTKTKKVWRWLTIMWHPAFDRFFPATFETKKDAKKFIEKMKKQDEIEYF